MTLIRHRLAAALLAAGIAAFCATSAIAAGAPDAPPDADQAAPADHGPGGSPNGGPGGPHAFGGPGPGAPGPDMPSYDGPGMHGMHGLHLSEAQQDKLFAIHHAAEPEQREHRKAIRKAHEALAELARAERFDDARAAALARDLGQAIGAEALLRARTEAQALAVLSPEQRERLQRHRTAGPQVRPGRAGQGPQGAPGGQGG